MTINYDGIRDWLQKFAFAELFTQELGWDWFTKTEQITVNEDVYIIDGVAEKRGVQIFHCRPDAFGNIPSSDTRAKIDRELTKLAREHLLIFSDAAKSEQLWLYTRRDPGRSARPCVYRFNPAAANVRLIQNLQSITFTLNDEESIDLLGAVRRLKDAFDKDKLTKKFYSRFQIEQKAFQAFIQGIPDDELQRWYAAVLINRVMFLYFLQAKGFLDGRLRFLQEHLETFQGNYYRDFLCPLFFQGFALAEDDPARPAEYRGKIPYLNGGIFQKHQIEETHGAAIQVENAAFARLFAFFDGWRWHLDERPLGDDNEINPDVLGYIFEKYINQKQMGAYYTKEDITGYIGRNTIIPYLFDAARKECKVAFDNPAGPTVWDLLRDDPDKYIYKAVRHGVTWDVHAGAPMAEPFPVPDNIVVGFDTAAPDLLERRKQWNKPAPVGAALPTEIWREVIARRQRYEEIRRKLENGEVRDINELITLNLDIEQFALDVVAWAGGPEMLRAFWHAITKITVLDPTCGSGAFLFAALNILEPIYEQCLQRMEEFVEDMDKSGRKHRPEKLADFRELLARVAGHPNRAYFIFKSIILKNLYGVDIMEEAVEICKLRLFLKLAAQVEPDRAKANLGIEPLPDIDFNIRAGNTLVGYATLAEVQKAAETDMLRSEQVAEIETKAADTQQLADNFRRVQTEGDGAVPADHKRELSRQMAELADVLNRHLAEDYGIDLTRKDGQKKYPGWLKSHQPFHWFTEFYGIMASGGFDVIIGNPPYVEVSKVSEYEVRNYVTKDAGNIYAVCVERCTALLSAAGSTGLIIPLSGFSTERMANFASLIRQHFNSIVLSFYSGDAHPSVLFAGVKYRLAILIGNKGSTFEKKINTSSYIRWYSIERPNLFHTKISTFENNNINDNDSMWFAKTGEEVAAKIVFKITEMPAELSASIRKSGAGHITYHRSPSFWIRSMDFEPYFKSPIKDRSTDHIKDLYFHSIQDAQTTGAIIASSLFYFWFTVQGNCRNITAADIETFRVGNLRGKQLELLSSIFNRLMVDLKKNSKRRTYAYKTGSVEYDEFYMDRSKPIMDEIDNVLAKHYGFTDEELDFIINYDIKYRMGRDAESADA